MRIELHVAALVLLSALIHASWNTIVKSDVDRLVSFAVVMISGTILCLFLAPFVAFPSSEAWGYIVASTIVHNFYYFFLLRAYAHGDLSHVYPIARGLGPLLVAIFSGRLIGEALTTVEYAGVLLVSIGVTSLALARGLPHGAEWRPTIYAVLTGMTIAGYTIIDGVGARQSGDAIAYIVWLNIAEGPWVMMVAIVRRGRVIVPYLQAYWWRGAAGGAIATIGYGIAIWALSLGAMAHVAALRETSVLFGALMGTFLLRESFGPRRIAAASVVVAGLLLMNLPILR
jgi:drug/metabolite transporter (DMT)-like permease